MLSEEGHYKVVAYLPEEFLEETMERVNGCMEPIYGGYDHVFSFWQVEGRWRPLEGSSPFLGEVGRIEQGKEIRLETTVRGGDVEAVVRTIRNVHPYEEPVIDIFPVITCREILGQ